MKSAFDRMKALADGSTIEPVGISMWKHFPDTDRKADKFFTRTVDFQLAGGWDFLKISYHGLYSVEDWPVEIKFPSDETTVGEVTRFAIQNPEDWKKITPNPVNKGAYARELAITKRFVERFRGEVPVIPTVFSPLTTAIKMADEPLFDHIRDDPAAVHQALSVITETTCQFVDQLVALGVDGIFFATQLGTWDRMDWDGYQQFGKKYDLEVLQRASSLWFNVFHIHGSQPMFKELSDYPVTALNWHDRTTDVSIRKARTMTDKVLIGGVDEHHTLLTGTEDKVKAELHDAVEQDPRRRIILGPGCVVPLTVTEDRLFRMGAMRP